MEFQVRSTCQEEDIYAYVRACRSVNARRPANKRLSLRDWIIPVIAWISFPLIYTMITLPLTFDAFWQRLWERWGYWFAAGALCVLIGIVTTLLTRFLNEDSQNRLVRSMWKKFQEDGIEEDHYTFRETDFLLSNSKGDCRWNYSGIHQILESPKYFFLCTPYYLNHIIPKRDFTQGDPAAFGPFLAEKCGKEIIQIP